MSSNLTTQEQQALNALLIDAVRDQNLSRIQECVRKGADIHVKVGGNDPLYSWMAANYFTENICNYFLSLGVNVDTQGSNGWRPLALAISSGDYERTRYYLSKNANPLALCPNGKTTLDIARDLSNAHDWRSEIIEAVLAAVPDKNAAPEKAKNLTSAFQPAALPPDHQRVLDEALFFALDNSDYDQISLCMQKGANINARNANSQTSIMIAAYKKEDLGLTAHILKFKPDLLLKVDGKTVFDMIMKNTMNGGTDKRKKLMNLLLTALPDANVLPAEYRPAAPEEKLTADPLPPPPKHLPRDEKGFHL
jgi:ankyrin repeat protein